MQILWKKYTKENFEMNVDECGIEQGIPGFGYKYEVLKNAVEAQDYTVIEIY